MCIHITTVERTAKTSKNKKINIEIPITIHPDLETEVIIINYPGYNGDINGYNNKYVTLAEFMREKIGAVVRSGNHYHPHLDYSQSVQDDLKAIINYVLKHAREICGTVNPTIYLMGFSAGASAVAAIAHEYPSVKKILLMAPSGDAGEEALQNGLANYTGEVYIVSGANDEVVGPEAAPTIARMVKKASSQHVIVPDCDHQFRGTENGMIMSNAPIWAFKGGIKFPSTEGGIVLY